MKSKFESHHLLILSKHYEAYKQLIEQAKLPDLSVAAFSDPNQAVYAGDRYDLAFGEPSLLSKVITQLPDVKWLQSSWAGVEPLVQPNLRYDYILTNIRNLYGPMISEYVIGYLIMIERQLLVRWQSQLKHEWDTRPYGSLTGKLIGILGVGTIGAHLAATAKHFGMQVYGYTRQSEASREVDQYFHGKNWREFASNVDYLVCCLPGTDSTRGIVDADFIAALPNKAWLVNVGRGGSVDEFALAHALNRRTLAGAVLDVFTEEPLPHEHPLWSTPNTYITAHIAAINNPAEIVKVFINNYKRYIQGESLIYKVDFNLGY
jgi:phosphoglycerate dehydrogenase-like enzyme